MLVNINDYYIIFCNRSDVYMNFNFETVFLKEKKDMTLIVEKDRENLWK